MQTLIAFFLITLLLVIVSVGIIMLVLMYQKKQLQYFIEKKELKISFEKEILESRLEIQEQTMKNISQEIHDNIGQVLSLVKLNLNSINCEDHFSTQNRIKDTSLLVKKALDDLRALARSLHTDAIIETGLIKSVENELEMMNKTGRYNISFKHHEESCNLSQQHELILFRIFQEALNNIIKHSNANAVTVTASNTGSAFQLEVFDNGEGFDLARQDADNAGLGIRNIKNRARIIGADCKIESACGQGTAIKISLPFTISRAPQMDLQQK